MQVIIDRFEGDYAVVETENGIFANLPKILVPNTVEGDVIEISVNKDETQKRCQNIKNLMDNLFEG